MYPKLINLVNKTLNNIKLPANGKKFAHLLNLLWEVGFANFTAEQRITTFALVLSFIYNSVTITSSKVKGKKAFVPQSGELSQDWEPEAIASQTPSARNKPDQPSGDLPVPVTQFGNSAVKAFSFKGMGADTRNPGGKGSTKLGIAWKL